VPAAGVLRNKKMAVFIVRPFTIGRTKKELTVFKDDYAEVQQIDWQT
jgi:hypothetical protein